METLFHLPLESYQARYTEHLRTWENTAFSKNFNVEEIKGPPSVSLDIFSGEVLDSIQRPVHAMGQMAELLPRLRNNPLKSKIWCSDFFHPGLESLPYSRTDYQVSSFLWAQSFDRYDFTAKWSWMRDWEKMAFEIYDAVFVASPLLKELIVAALPQVEQKVFVVGLPFDPIHVRGTAESVASTKDIDVVWSSRFDEEKNPEFFLSLVEQCPDLSFAICTGHATLRGTATQAVQRATKLIKEGRLTLHADLTKPQYYHVLSRARAQFNCAKQDWVSYTLLEALTFGCVPVYPARRSFLDTFNGFYNFLYQPGNAEDAARLLYMATDFEFRHPNYATMQASILGFNAGALAQISTTLSRL